MASGNITLYIESVDYNGGGAYTRGAQYSNLNARWNVDSSGWLTLTEQSYSTNTANWWICSSQATDMTRYRVEWKVQFKPDGGSWQTLYTDKEAVLGPCSNYTYQTGTNVKRMMEDFCSGFSGVQLTQSGELRVVCGANLAPAPDASYPYAFPNDVYSESTQVPVHIDVDYRPGAVLTGGAWKSTNRSAGKCHLRSGGSWVEMKTADGGTGTGNPPSRRTSGTWKNQYKIGSD